MIENRIPAGLMDKGTELFTCNGRAWGLHDGARLPFAKLPRQRRQVVQLKMKSQPIVEQAMEVLVGKNEAKKLERFSMCQYGAINHEADIDEAGNLSAPEYVPCSQRGLCPVEGIGCANILVAEGVFLTKCETAVFIRVKLPDKLIADELGISIFTVKEHFKSIRIKSGLLNKIEMSAYATQRGII
jgi:hypothetical protein